MAAERERGILNHYNLTTLTPDSWPHAADDSSDSETDSRAIPNPIRRASSRFQALDRQISVRSSLSGKQKTLGGVDSLVQKDEPDPLGLHASVAGELHRRGLPVDENLRLRNRFMLSSTSFSPALFLSQVHQDASTNDLLRGLESLSRSIEQKSASLKVLVESNFERFVRAKATIDSVYTEMRTQGGEENVTAPPTPGRKTHSRTTSRTQSSSHFRNASNNTTSGYPFSPANKDKALPSDKKKNALTKESEYGVQGIKAPLLEVAVKAEEVWGPALGGKEREEALKAVLKAVEEHSQTFKLPGGIAESIKQNDYEATVQQHSRARRYAEEAKALADAAHAHDKPLTDGEVLQIIVTGRMWYSVSEQLDEYQIELWKRLVAPPRSISKAVNVSSEDLDKDNHMEIIGLLLQLGVEQSPIWEWLKHRMEYLRDRIARTFERSRIEIEISRRRLASGKQADMKTLAQHLRSAAAKSPSMDTPGVLAFWEKVQGAMTSILSLQGGVLGEVIEFWETAQSFIDGKAQRKLPAALSDSGNERLELSPEDVSTLRNGTAELITLLREDLFAFFAEAPVEDISSLYSPIPPAPLTPGGNAMTPSSARSLTFKPEDLPPPSPKRGEAWEKFAFWPPYSNSLSGSHHLSRILILVGTAASEMASLSVLRGSQRSSEQLKSLVGGIRERCVQAVCAAWNTDAERCKLLEKWTRNAERRDLTTMPAFFAAFEEQVLLNVQRILYIQEAMSGSAERNGAGVVVPPSARLLQMVKSQFVTSLYKALSGMVENAEKENKSDEIDELLVPLSRLDDEGVGNSVDAGNKNVRMLLTLSNIAHLRSETIPQLISHFESSFSVKLTEESKTIRDVLGQIDARLFQSYVKPTLDNISSIITKGITSPTWIPDNARPKNARPYVYEVLLAMVLVHTEVSTTATSLTNQILSFLLEGASTALIAAFRQRSKYSLPALMQATLDVEFMAQTLNNYTTDKAGEVQSQIYLALDERTDNESRSQLQAELPEMRAVLKRLREATRGEFGCFKRERRGRERPGSRT